MDPQFTWDRDKAAANRRKHGVSFEEALRAFRDPLARIHDDPHHSDEEHREILVGHSARGRLLLVSCVERGRTVRLISARRATRNESQDYQEGTRL